MKRTLNASLQNLRLLELRKHQECKSYLFSITELVHPPNQQQEITNEQIHKLCKLARLGISQQESQMNKLKRDLNEVISCLHQLPNSNVTPTYSPLQLRRNNELSQRWRTDAVETTIDTKAILKHAPFIKANCYLVSKPKNKQEEEF
jgi:aspartyl/glutamyl-tRNA(Asn/Gln) amidotransferase C subunit